MKKIKSNMVGIDAGDFILFSDFDTGGEMWVGSGPRQHVKEITFSEPFLFAPSVHLTISLWDVNSHHNLRMDFQAQNVTATGFQAIFKTWGDTKIARLHMSWQAIGAVADPDEYWALTD